MLIQFTMRVDEQDDSYCSQEQYDLDDTLTEFALWWHAKNSGDVSYITEDPIEYLGRYFERHCANWNDPVFVCALQYHRANVIECICCELNWHYVMSEYDFLFLWICVEDDNAETLKYMVETVCQHDFPIRMAKSRDRNRCENRIERFRKIYTHPIIARLLRRAIQHKKTSVTTYLVNLVNFATREYVFSREAINSFDQRRITSEMRDLIEQCLEARDGR